MEWPIRWPKSVLSYHFQAILIWLDGPFMLLFAVGTYQFYFRKKVFFYVERLRIRRRNNPAMDLFHLTTGNPPHPSYDKH
jgi:hypothetical protein